MTQSVAPGAQITTLALEVLRPHPSNRKHFDKKKLAELVENVRKVGILTPLLVRPIMGPHASDAFEIIAGERRWRAADEAGLETLPCIVRELTDDEALEILITENLQREDPHPLEEADSFQAWLDRPGHDVTGLAAKIGKSTGYIYQRLQLQKLIEPAKKLLWEDEGLPLTLALLLSREPEATQKEHLQQIKRDLDWNGYPTAAGLTRDLQRGHRDLTKVAFSTTSADLLPIAGSCTACPKRTGFAPELFPEIGKKADKCTDAGCFTKKLQAHLAAEQVRLKAEHPDLVLVSNNYSHAPVKEGQPVPQPQWQAARKGDKGAKFALIVDGESLGATTWVTLGQKKSSSSSRSPSRPTAPKVDATKERLKSRREIGRRRAVLQAVLDVVGKPLDRRLLLPILALELDVGDFDSDRFEAVTGIKRRPGLSFTAAHLEKLTERQLNQVMVLLDVAFEPSSGSGTPAHLLALAKAMKVNAKAVGDRFEAAAKKGLKGTCAKCLCTKEDPCTKGGKPCAWTSRDETLCSACADAPPAKKGAKK